MGKVVMTLLVPRKPKRNATYPYAVQMTYPTQTAGQIVFLTEVRLIVQDGRRTIEQETEAFYHPEEWRAATLGEQAIFASLYGGNPQPWFPRFASNFKSIYEFDESGDKDTNNGQDWSEIEDLEGEWEAEEEERKKFQQHEDAWKKREQDEQERRIAKWGEG